MTTATNPGQIGVNVCHSNITCPLCGKTEFPVYQFNLAIDGAALCGNCTQTTIPETHRRVVDKLNELHTVLWIAEDDGLDVHDLADLALLVARAGEHLAAQFSPLSIEEIRHFLASTEGDAPQ